MALTGKFKFRKTLWGKIVLQIEDEVKPFWSRSKPGTLKRRWRDATLMDLAAPEMRTLIDMRFRPHVRPASIGVQHGETVLGSADQVLVQPSDGEPTRITH